LHLGPNCILIAVALLPGDGEGFDHELAREIERQLKSIDPRIREVLYRFQTRKGPAKLATS
jgi:hypothetical protein